MLTGKQVLTGKNFRGTLDMGRSPPGLPPWIPGPEAVRAITAYARADRLELGE
jgi:hypothetical protein